jgi:hypothetical protein
MAQNNTPEDLMEWFELPQENIVKTPAQRIVETFSEFKKTLNQNEKPNCPDTSNHRSKPN